MKGKAEGGMLGSGAQGKYHGVWRIDHIHTAQFSQ